MKRRRKKIIKPAKPLKSGSVFHRLSFHKLDWLEKIAIVLCIWFLIYPQPYRILLGLLLLLPVLGLVLNGLHKPSITSLVEISKDENNKDTYDVADFIDLPALVILVRVVTDFEFDNIRSMLWPGVIACALIVIFLFATHKQVHESTKNKVWIYASVITSLGIYSFAGVYAANCGFDNSNPEIYRSAILEKNIHRSRKSTRYKVRIAPWGHHLDKETIAVSIEQYKELEIGDSVNIDLKKGLFNIPWYYIERKKEKNW